MFTKPTKPNEPTMGTTPAPTTSLGSVEAPRRAIPVARSAPSLISADVTIKGSIKSAGEVQVDGSIEGDIRATALTIGETGKVKGEVVAETVIIRGEVTGSIRARKVQLASSSRVDGDIIHSSLAIEANAKFQGQVRFVEDALKEEKSEG
jgi:cytoskeletal protein CcmA (bactofilin family)